MPCLPLLNRDLGSPGSATPGLFIPCHVLSQRRAPTGTPRAARSQGANATPLPGHPHPDPAALSPSRGRRQPHLKICPRRWHICAW